MIEVGQTVKTKLQKGGEVEAVVVQLHGDNEVQVRTTDGELRWRTVKTVTKLGETSAAPETPTDKVVGVVVEHDGKKEEVPLQHPVTGKREDETHEQYIERITAAEVVIPEGEDDADKAKERIAAPDKEVNAAREEHAAKARQHHKESHAVGGPPSGREG